MNSDITSKNRIPWIDMAKGYGILAVFLGHLVQGSPLGDFVYSFHLPLFFFISGFLFSTDKYLSFGSFLKHKEKSILLPYFTLGPPIVIFAAYYPIVFSGKYPRWIVPGSMLLRALKDNLSQYVIQMRYATLWYLAALFGINLVMYALTRLKNRAVKAVIVALLFILGYTYYRLGGFRLPWNIDAVPMALPFFYVGYVLKGRDGLILDLSKTKRVVLFVSFMLLNILANAGSFAISGEGLEMYWVRYGVLPLTYISAFAGVFGIITLSTLFSWRPLCYIGRHSMIYFLWHQAIFFELWKGLISSYGLPYLVISQIILTLILLTLIRELFIRLGKLTRMVTIKNHAGMVK